MYLTFTFSSGFVVLETVVEGFVDVVTVVAEVAVVALVLVSVVDDVVVAEVAVVAVVGFVDEVVVGFGSFVIATTEIVMSPLAGVVTRYVPSPFSVASTSSAPTYTTTVEIL